MCVTTDHHQQVHSHVKLSAMLVTFKVGTLATFDPLSSTPAPSLSQQSLSTGIIMHIKFSSTLSCIASH